MPFNERRRLLGPVLPCRARWRAVAQHFVAVFATRVCGESVASPLGIVVDAGAHALPTLLKLAQVMQASGSKERGGGGEPST